MGLFPSISFYAKLTHANDFSVESCHVKNWWRDLSCDDHLTRNSSRARDQSRCDRYHVAQDLAKKVAQSVRVGQYCQNVSLLIWLTHFCKIHKYHQLGQPGRPACVTFLRVLLHELKTVRSWPTSKSRMTCSRYFNKAVL